MIPQCLAQRAQDPLDDADPMSRPDRGDLIERNQRKKGSFAGGGGILR